MGDLFGGRSKSQPTQTTTTTANREPWSAAQPYMKNTMKAASKLYDSGVGSDVYRDSQVIPFASQTTQGMNSITDLATGQTGRNMSANYSNVIDNGGMNAEMQQGVSGVAGFAGGTGPSNSERNLGGYATGEYFNDNDPHFERLLKSATDAAADETNFSASAAGRYGSGTHQGVLAESVGDVQAKARFSQYQDLKNRQFAANQQIDAVDAQNMNRELAANTTLFGQGQQAFDNIGTAYNGAKAPAQDMMNIGSMYEDLNRREINDNIRIFNEEQANPWRALGQANAIYSGAGSMGGSSTGTATAPDNRPSFLQQALGTGAQVAGRFF
ncbi:MAG: hypothetical protein COA78_17245 [Blastopirellula sp.]|nr:MAG: hypothetical protein COA78_17245 [Blastopirellula sp.]